MRDSLSLRPRLLVLALCVLPAIGLAAPAPALAETCPNAQFRVGPSLHLPDCRAYELVTPSFKNGDAATEYSDISHYGDISPNGEAVGFSSETAFAGAGSNEGLFGADEYVAQRTSAGWMTNALELPSSEYLSAFSEGFSGNAAHERTQDQLTEGWFARGPSDRENEIDLYRYSADGSIADVGPILPPEAPNGPPVLPEIETGGIAGGYEVRAQSADGTHVVFMLYGYAVAQWPGTEPGTLLEYIGTGNTTPLLLGVEDNGKFVDECPTQQIRGLSANGSVAFISDNCHEELFARINNGEPGAHTVAISEPSKEDCAECDTEPGVRQPASYIYTRAGVEGYSWALTEDGSKVLFTTKQPLLGGKAEEDIYEYDFDEPAGQRVIRVTAGDSTVSNPAVELQGVTSASKDLSHVYFVAGGVLTKTANYRGEVAQQGAHNLYLSERDAQYPAGRTVFIAPVNGVPSGEASSDGQFLVFNESANLAPGTTNGGAYEYDSTANTMVRVSIGQNGYNDNGNGAGIGSPIISGTGSYVFFESPDGLTPQALNNVVVGQRVTAQNVYEYHAGSLSLISDGHDITAVPGIFENYRSAVKLVGTDFSGDDVFFTTEDQLVGQDTNTSVDLYDARINGGFPPPTEPPECQGDACQGQLGAAPVLLSPGSEFQAGGEDFNAEEPKVVGSSKPGSKPKAKKPTSKRKKGKTKHKAKAKVKVKRGAARKSGRASRARVAGRNGGLS